jgi:ribose 1,5-bisphosphokinase
MRSNEAHGTLFLVVGPSGVGKDTLMDGVRQSLVTNDRYYFARRTVTRPSDAGGEVHEAVSKGEFEARAADGKFALHWSAHDLHYGITWREVSPLANGIHVVANVSRNIINEARKRFHPLIVVSVNVPSSMLRSRLEARARESEDDITRRLARAASIDVEGPDVRRVMNDSTIAIGVARFQEVLTGSAAYSPV